MGLTRDQIMGSSDLQPRTVEVPEWGGTVYLRGLMAGEVDALRVAEGNASARLVALALCDGQGISLGLTESDLAGKSAVVIARLAKIATEINAMTEATLETLKGNS